MSTPLKDFRCAITEAIDIALEAVAREVLGQWAKRKIHEHRVMARLLMANGLQPELDGLTTADDGLPRQAPERARR